jgi:hypothetical protein
MAKKLKRLVSFVLVIVMARDASTALYRPY